jgi:glyoxylase-like metal-dependent hydrolase (beta-lactamase superfamily II)
MRFPEVNETYVDAGDARLLAIHTPGHAPDHICFLDEQSGDLYCGDMLRAGGTIVIPASKGGSVREYLDSLRRIRSLSPRRLLPGHGPSIDDPSAAIASYLAHRAEREEQIIAALRGGFRSADEIARDVYGELPAALAPAAVDSVLAHLLKLQEEGRAMPAASPSAAIAGQPSVSPPSAWRLV